MSGGLAGLVGFATVLLLAGLRVPVAVAMGVVGAIGSVLLMGWPSASYLMASLPFEAVFPYSLSIVPLFIFMGVFATHSGLSRNLYTGVHALMGHRPGGIAMATVGASAVFGAISGSSLATCATIGKVALPEMQRRGYSARLAGASVAAGGTLGVMIPPSIILVLYALLTEQSIGALFAAALIPGILGTLLYLVAIDLQVRVRPELGPADRRMSWRESGRALLGTWDAGLLIVLVIGGIYSGVFSPTEAAAVGAGGALVITAAKRRLTLAALGAGLSETAQMTGMVFLILIGAALFNLFIEATQLPTTLVTWVGEAGLSTAAVIALIILFYIVLGCFMDSLSMILLTVVPAYSIITQLGLDPIWFGILLVTVAEIGLITPPIGMNLFVIQSLSKDLSLAELALGVVPFVAADIVRVILLAAFPTLSLWLPSVLRF